MAFLRRVPWVHCYVFLIYVNTLPSQVTDGVLLQYADATTLIHSGSYPLAAAEVMNSQLQLVYDWTASNKMQLNVNKSKVMWFSASRTKSVSPEIKLINTVLEVVDTQLYLGIMFDNILLCARKCLTTYIYLLNCQRHDEL